MYIIIPLFIKYNMYYIEKATQHIAIHYYIITVILHYLLILFIMSVIMPVSYAYANAASITISFIILTTPSISAFIMYFILLIFDCVFNYYVYCFKCDYSYC